MRNLTVLALLVALSLPGFAQKTATAMPDLERFNPEQADKSLDPCSDFFQYACSKWVKANPIPSDQAAWGTFNALAIWNLAALHETLESAADPAAKHSASEAKAGDYYASCMDETA